MDQEKLTKLCKKCNTVKDLKFMVKHSAMKDGYSFCCKECEKRARLANKGKVLNITVIEKYCPICDETKSPDEFYKSTKGLSADGLQFLCSDCYNYHHSLNKGQDKNYFKKLQLSVSDEFRDHINTQKRENSRKNHISTMLSNAKQRAERKGLEFSLVKEDIIIPELCPILKVPFVTGTKDNYDFTPTIDRINNSKGYTPDNIHIITNKANTMKNSADFAMLHNFANYIKETIK
jgi:uncharacterized protein YlaI